MAMAMAQNRFNPSVVDAAFSLSDALMLTGRVAEAAEMLQWAYTETRNHNYRDYYIVAYRQLAELHRATGKYDIALRYMDSLMMIKDTLTNADKARAINHLEIKYKTYEKDLKITENELLIEKQKNALTRKNLLVWAIGSVIVFLVGLLFFRYRNTRNKERLQQEQIKSLQQENTIGILNAKVEGEEKERGRIARELHDGIGGMLSATMMRLSTLPRQAAEAAEAPAYKEAMILLGEMGDEIRKTSHNLMPESLLKQDLSDALNTLCSTLQADGKHEITYQYYGDYSLLSQDVKLNVYRIIQELLKNIMQHAHATKVLVQTVLHEGSLNITVEDNGAGFETGKSTVGIGLYNLEARVHSLNGHYTLDSASDKGTTVNIELDLYGIK
jgi:signal transduction histidine kinase